MRAPQWLLAIWLAGCGSDVPPLDSGFDPVAAPFAAGSQASEVRACEPLSLRSVSSTAICSAEEPAAGVPSARDWGLVAASRVEGAGLAAPRDIGGPCQERFRGLLAKPGLPGAVELETNRARILAYAKAEPVFFTQTPRPDAEASVTARRYREWLERSNAPWSLLQKLVLVFAANPSVGRSVLLREGYLYAEKPELAFALVDLVKAHHLFDAPIIWIQRGEELLTASRNAYGQYVYESGPQVGQRVRLLLFDRIGTGDVSAPLHRDLRSVRRRLGFDRIRVEHMTPDHVLAELRYGAVWVPTVLESHGARLELGCEVTPPDRIPRLAAFRDRRSRNERILATLRRVMLAGVEEGLPFDEPMTEYGQQDGQLRRFWLRAYLDGKSKYEINGDRYNTFDVRGRPLVPQVCVDFVFDTLERASGTWWRARGEVPERTIGELDFGTLQDETLRRASSFIELAKTRTDWFETLEVPESERVPLKQSGALVEYLLERADDFVPGDIVLIRGYAPWDKPWRPKVMHYHSFFVYETDPVTGFPAMLVGNPGRPLLQTWQFEAFRTPERSIWYRMRPRLEWLEGVIETNADEEAKLSSVPLAAGPG
jgi:hypothetical protein